VPRKLAPDASIGAASLRDGEWLISTLTFEEWHASLRGQAQSHNIDYFTLIRHDNLWKMLSGSYTSVPIDSR
jgi:hypothetical protein